MLQLKPNVRKYWATAGDMIQLFQSGEIVAGEGWPLMTAQLRAAGFPAGEMIPTEGTTAWADHWVLTCGRQEPERRVRLAGVRVAAVHPEADGRRDQLHRRQSRGEGIHVAGTGRDPAGHRGLRQQGQLLAVESAARQVHRSVERGEGGEVGKR